MTLLELLPSDPLLLSTPEPLLGRLPPVMVLAQELQVAEVVVVSGDAVIDVGTDAGAPSAAGESPRTPSAVPRLDLLD